MKTPKQSHLSRKTGHITPTNFKILFLIEKGISLKNLNSKIFAPFFFTMGLGAFNDNLFKSAIAIFITYNLPENDANFLVQLSAGLFILPFFLFSGISGQICDKYEKSGLMKKIKILEIFIMVLGAVGFLTTNINLLLITLFLMGAQSTLFGPVKYSILPQHLKGELLLRGNAFTSMGTFIFILVGTILGGFLVSTNVIELIGYHGISIGVVIFAILGLLASLYIPTAPAANPNQRIAFNIVKQTLSTLKLAHYNRKTFDSIYGISWFWFFGFFFMASLPIFCRDIINGNELVATFYLAIISIGMGIGSILGNKLSNGRLKMGHVGISGILLSIFALIFSLSSKIPGTNPLHYDQLIHYTSYLQSIFSLFLIGIFGGILIVPLYTQLQLTVPDEKRSAFIASNNIMNALFMVSAAIFSMILFAIGLQINEIFIVISVLNFIMFSYYIFRNPRDFYLAFFELLIRSIYKVEVKGAQNFQDTGPVIVAANHISFIDPLLLCVCVNRPPIFIMDQAYFDLKILQWFYTSAKAIPITPNKISPEGLEKAMKQTQEDLKSGEMLAIFPEGFITKDGEIKDFKEGIQRLGATIPELNLYPVAISGMWGSWFSRHINGSAMNGLPTRRSFRTKITVSVGLPIKGPDIIPSTVREQVENLRGNIK